MKTLWNAANDTAYCQEKAEAFVAKLTSWGWDCTAPETAPVSAPEAESMPEAAAEPEASSTNQ